MSASQSDAGPQLWLELPRPSATAPARLLVFLHGAGSTPEAFAPVAIAWQLKFPGATALLLQGLRARARGFDWMDASARDARGRPLDADQAVQTLAARIQNAQAELGLSPAQTVLVGFGQGATLALALARIEAPPVAIVVSYAGRLLAPLREGERILPTVHLLQGGLDSVVPAVHATQAFRGLAAVGAQATLDVLEDEAHTLGQEMINQGTARVMQTLFQGRRPGEARRLH